MLKVVIWIIKIFRECCNNDKYTYRVHTIEILSQLLGNERNRVLELIFENKT